MKERKVIVTTSVRDGFDMAGWCLEKSVNVVRNLARLHDVATQGGRRTGEYDDSALIHHLSTAIHDAALLCTLFAGSEIDGDQAVEQIAANGFEGFEEFAYAHGLIDETKKHTTLRSRYRSKDSRT